MTHLQDRLHEDREYIRKIEAFNEKDINHFVAKDSVNIYLLENMCRTATEEVTSIETQLSGHEVTMHILEKINDQTIAEETYAWGAFVSSLAGPT